MPRSESFATLNGFRQTNRMRRENLSRKFIALFRYEDEHTEEPEGTDLANARPPPPSIPMPATTDSLSLAIAVQMRLRSRRW